MKHTYIETTDIGDQVFCDACGKEYTDADKQTGGFLFGSKAYCPDCAVKSLPRIKSYGEERFIRGTCPPDKSYYRWVIDDLRKGNNLIKVTSVKDE